MRGKGENSKDGGEGRGEGEREGEGGRAHSWSGVIPVRGLRIIGVRGLGFKGFGV